MADSALSTDLLERYGVIEKAYCEERWSSVIYDGQTLLGDLSRPGEQPPEGLKERLQLLIAHAFLYGLGDRDSAEDLYQSVLRSGAEAALRQIAEQGLQQCALPVAAPESLGESPEQDMDPHPDPDAPSTLGTSLWSEDAAELPADPASPSQSGSAPPVQEGSAPLQGLQDGWGPAASQPPSGEDGALGWLTTEATASTATAQVRTAMPVMPWLETGSAVTSTPATPFQPEQASGAADLPARRDEEQPASGFQASEGEPTWTSIETAPAQVDSSPDVPSAVPAAGGELTPPARDDVPLLPPETTVSLQVSEAASGLDQPPGRLQPVPDLDLAVQGDRSGLPLAWSAASQEPQSRRDDQESFASGLSASSADERLVPDVVEEPELIELHQADSLHREEVVVQAVADDAAPLSEADRRVQEQESVEAGLPASLHRRGSDGMPGEIQDRRAEPPLEPIPPEEPAPVFASSTPEVVSDRRPFSGPPQPVAEEDPELLMGLLKVEMG